MNYVDSLNLFGIEAKEIPCIKGSGAPTDSTVGVVGLFYMNTDNGDVYKCTAVNGSSYTWLPMGNSSQTSGDVVDLSGVVKSVNGQTPDENGNVEIEVSGGNVDLTGGATVEPAEDDMPKVFLTGSEFGNMTTAKNEVNMGLEYISKTDKFKADIKIKFQGNTSLTFPKKNFTIKMYTDDSYEDKLKKNFKDWNHSGNKYVLKANYIDHSHARNIVAANLWSEVVASRPDYDSLPVELRNSPRNGAIDGFPVKLYVNGTYQGVYTWNVGKDDWMWGMDEDNANHVLMCAESNAGQGGAATACNFRALWNGVDGNHWSVEVGTNSTALKDSLNNLIQFVMDNDGDNFRNGIGNYLDIQSAIDYYIFQYEICGIDGLGKNMLLATYDGTKWICGAYDMDSTFGLYWNGSKFVAATYACPENYEEPYSLLWERIESIFLPELKARQAELRKTVLSYSNMTTHFERFMDVIGLDLYAEDLTIYTGIPSGSTNNIKQIRNFIRDRQTYVDAEFASMTGEQPDNPEPSEIPCTGISLDKTNLTFDGVGTQTIVATITPSDTTDAVVWVSSTPTVASISVDGNVCTVRSVGNGDATVTVTCGKYSASCSVAVSGIDVSTDIVYSLGQETVFNGVSDYINTGVKLFETNSDFSIAIEFTGAGANRYKSLFSCMDYSGRYPGITLDCPIDGFYNAYDRSILSNIKGTDVMKHRLVAVKDATTATVEMYFDTADNVKTFSDADRVTSVFAKDFILAAAQVNNGNYVDFWDGTIHNCLVYGRKMTSDEIEAYLNSDMNEPVPCTGISLDKNVLTFTEEGSQTITATVTPSDTTDVVIWSSNVPSIASVDGGVVTSKANGTAVITATCGSQSAICNVYVSGAKTYLYNNGDTCDAVSGGWNQSEKSSIALTFGDDCMYGQGCMVTGKKFDLTNINTLNATINANYMIGTQTAYFGIMSEANAKALWDSTEPKYKVVSETGEKTTFTLDVSGVSGEYYVAVSFNNSYAAAAAYFYEVWLK